MLEWRSDQGLNPVLTASKTRVLTTTADMLVIELSGYAG